MAEPIMLGTENSPDDLLCSNLSGGVESVNRPLGYISCLLPPDPNSIGEQASPTPTVMELTMAPGKHIQAFQLMDHMAAEYYSNYHPPSPMRNWHPPEQFPGYYPAANSGYLVAADDSIVPTHQAVGTALDFGGHYGPHSTQQPPMPPAAPECSISSDPPFHYHLCRWLSGPRCDGGAPGKNREMGEHLRVCHHFVGHERDTVECQWENCGQVMQRMNIPRHIVSRHLLAAANCRFCSKQFSRPDVVSRHERTCSGAAPASSSSATDF